MNLFIIQLAILFLPGLIWARFDSHYVLKEKPTYYESLIKSFIFGLVTYSILYLIYTSIGFQFSPITYDSENKIFTNGLVLFIDEILFSIPLAFILSIIWLYVTTYKVFTRLLQNIGATKKYGDEDVWDYTFNSSDAAVEYVHLRDFENELVYAGWVSTFSETGRLRELVMRDVQVYRFGDETCLYEVPRLYIAKEPNNIHIEFPYKEEQGNNNAQID